MYIPVKPRDHENLLVGLGRLRQSIEPSSLNTAWHQVITCTFRRALHQGWRFDLDEIPLLEVSVGDLIHSASNEKILLHRRTAQVYVAILQAQVLPGLDTVVDRERRSFRFIEDGDIRGSDINFPCFDGSVGGPFRSDFHRSRDSDDVFRSKETRIFMCRGIVLRVEHHLGFSVAVTKVDEDDTAQISARIDPTIQDNGFSYVAPA